MEKELRLVKQVAKEVSTLGGKVYFVGGYVRDKVLNKENKDIDVEVYGLTLEDLKGVLTKFGGVEEIGASFGVLMVKGYEVDFTLPRTESSTGSKHTDFEIKVDGKLSVKEATKRRDFTMNALLQDVLTGEYVDLYGGVSDIKSKTIRYVDEHTFKEDELRVFRACQFASRFNFSIDKGVIEVAKQFGYQSLSKERIFEEFNKALLKSDKPSIAFNYLYEMGVVEKLFPELYKLKGCEQSKEHHPEGDVWNHTMLVLDECARLRNNSTYPLGLMYAGLCHDLGKPDTKVLRDNGKITFHNHEEVGVEVAGKFLSRLTNDKKLVNYVKNLTEHHMKGHRILEVKDTTLRKLFTKVDMGELLLITEADELGRGVEVREDFGIKLKEYENRIKNLSMGAFGKVEPIFKGRDLIKMGYEPGIELGNILKEVYQWQLGGYSKEKIELILQKRLDKIKNDGTINNSNRVENTKLEDKLVSKRNKSMEYFKYLKRNEEKSKNKKG